MSIEFTVFNIDVITGNRTNVFYQGIIFLFFCFGCMIDLFDKMIIKMLCKKQGKFSELFCKGFYTRRCIEHYAEHKIPSYFFIFINETSSGMQPNSKTHVQIMTKFLRPGFQIS